MSTSTPSLRPPALAQTRRASSGRKGLPALFLTAAAGVLLALGVTISALTGWIGAVAYAGVLAAVLAVALVRGQRAATPEDHQGCACCEAAAAAPAPAGTITL